MSRQKTRGTAPALGVSMLLALLLPGGPGELSRLDAFDKNGVAPRAISLPSGPGSIQGLGESFQPQLNTGSGSYNVPLFIPRGTGGQAPELSLTYNSGAGNGALGLGWSLSGLPSIRRNTDRGVPLYTDGPNGLDDDLDGQVDNPEELDTFTGLSGEELVPLPDGSYRAENEGSFVLYRRSGAGWEARSRDGDRLFFGQSAQARVEEGGRVFSWCLERQIDKNQNAIDYEYRSDPATPAQKHIRRIRWGQPAAFLAAFFSYEEGRPDVTVSFQPRFELRTAVRLSGIEIYSQGLPAQAFARRSDVDGDGQGNDALIRRYRLEYEPTAHLSLLTRITLLGADGLSALPTLSFGYSQWTPPDNSAASMIRSREAPVQGFDSASTELIDMNGDGLPDLLSTSGSQHRVSLNRGLDAEGRLAWAPSQPVGNAPTIDLASDRTHLADATADGLSDLLVKVSNTSFLCFDNTSQNSWTGSPFPIRATDTWPIWPFDGDSGKQSRSIDSDYSRSNDVLHTTDSGVQLWLLLSGGRFSREMRLPPIVCEGKTFRFDLPGTHIADLNGDRLQDLAWIQASRVVYFPNRGRGDFGAPVILNLGRTLSAVEIERGDFSDIDGDGLVDLTLVRPAFQPTAVVYWLNRFERGLEGPRAVGGLPALNAGDALRWADMNGNGTTDIVIAQGQSDPGEKILVIDLVPEGKIHLLEEIDNGLGLKIHLDYESSTAQMVRAQEAGSPWASRMPIAVTVVSRIAEDDGRGQEYEQTFAYRDPYYDSVKQEFRGFQGAESRQAGDASIPGKRQRSIFDTGRADACFKGKLVGQETLDFDGKLFERSLFAWGLRVLGTGVDGREVCYAFQESSDRFVHEGEVNGIRLRQESDPDDYGNIVLERNLGRVDETGDELVIERSFDLRIADWVLNLPARETVRDGTGKTATDQKFFHDARGNLERTESWLDTEDRWIVIQRQSYDAFGNAIEWLDARGSRRATAFDELLHAWPVSETVFLEARELTLRAEYDLGLGVVSGAVNFYGERTEYLYDPLARLLEKRMPGGAGETYEYQLGNPVSRVIKRLREDAAGGTFDSYVYSDGMGRPLGTKVESEGGGWRGLEFHAYNSRKLAARSWLPFSSDTPELEAPAADLPVEQRSFDAMERLVQVIQPDGSVNRTEYGPLEVRVFDGNDVAAGGQPDRRRSDGLGRTISVEERNGAETYLTRYGWSTRGELASVVDAQGNTRRFHFDSQRRLFEVEDPDRGRRKYFYDDSGNRIRSEDARGHAIEYVQDAANRLLRRVYKGAGAAGADKVQAELHYDEPAGVLDFGDGTQGTARNVLGRLAWVADATGEEHYSYDERGNIEWSLKRIRDAATGILVPYLTRRAHDLQNREAEIIFPDNDRIRYTLNAGGFVERIDGGPQGLTILSEADFAASGQPLRLRFGNGIESSFSYDAGHRLETLRTADAAGKEILEESLAYDDTSNVIEINDLRPLADVPADAPRRRTARFTYDELHRLTRVVYGDPNTGGRIDYEYDAIGNLVRQSTPAAGQAGHIGDAAVDLGTLSYLGGRSGRPGREAQDPPGPHAVTGTGNGRQLGYDASGNVASLDGAALRWDFEDRLERYTVPGVEADYLHDHSGERIAKRVLRGRARDETLYPDPDFEAQNGSPIKYAMLDDRRIARIRGRLDPSREAVQRILLVSGWNLIAAAVQSPLNLQQLFGIDAAIYQASGESYAPVDASGPAPAGKPLWVFAPAARLAVLRGPIPAAPAGPSPGPLHAWPRLDPFQPASHIDNPGRLMVYSAGDRSWLAREPGLPSFLSDAPSDLGAAAAFWAPEAVVFKPAAAEEQSVVYYHADHLGSPAAITGPGGSLIEETARYPYGAIRSLHRPGAAAGDRQDFTGKERDAESGIISMGARGYLDFAGAFLSPDPRYADIAELAMGSSADQASFDAFLANPQLGNLYAYAARNPLKFVDPSGLDIVFSKGLRDSPVFKEALSLFKKTKEGARILKSLKKSGININIEGGRAFHKGKEVLGLNVTKIKKNTADITINVQFHVESFKNHDKLIRELADTIHHELRHTEGKTNAKNAGIRQAREIFKILDGVLDDAGMPTKGMPDRFRIKGEVDRALDTNGDDPYNKDFNRQARKIQKQEKAAED